MMAAPFSNPFVAIVRLQRQKKIKSILEICADDENAA